MPIQFRPHVGPFVRIPETPEQRAARRVRKASTRGTTTASIILLFLVALACYGIMQLTGTYSGPPSNGPSSNTPIVCIGSNPDGSTFTYDC